jgi:hypothetical protein
MNMRTAQKLSGAILGVLLGLPAPSVALAGQIHICAVNNNPDDWEGMWHWGGRAYPGWDDL